MRLFVALDVPEHVGAAIAGLSAKLRLTCPSARWVRIEGAHVTLKFIGEVSAERADEIKAALATVLFSTAVPIHFTGVGFFPNDRRPRVLWAGVEASAELAALAVAVDSALGSLGFAPETRAFSPHLTLARFDPPGGKGALDALHAAIAKAGPFEFGDAIQKEFHLYLSILKRGGAEYTRLATFYSVGSKPR